MVGIARFQQGALVQIGKSIFRLLRKINGVWQLGNVRTNEIKEYSDDRIHQMHSVGELIFVNEESDEKDQPKKASKFDGGHASQSVSPEDWEAAKVRRQFVLAVLELPLTPDVMEPEIQIVWEKLQQQERGIRWAKNPPHWTTVMRWKQRYLKSGKDIYSLVERRHLKGNGRARTSDRVQEIIGDSVRDVYLQPTRPSIEDTLNHAIVLVENENLLRPVSAQLSRPTRRQIKREIDGIPAFDKYVARYGREAGLRKFRSVQSHRVTEAPLERAEMDHTTLDLMVVDDDTFLPLGRPVFTGCVDDFSRCILGMNAGFQPPSHLVVARCLRHAVLPKIGLREQYPEIENDWYAYGVMKTLVVDNDLAFHGESLEAFCLPMNIEIEYSPRKTPWYKPKIERFMRTSNDGVAHGQPGTTFTDIFEKGDYDPAKHATIRLSTFKKILNIWIVDVYHQKEHRALGCSPAAMWKSSIADEEIDVPADVNRLDALLGRIEYRKLTHKGVELDGLLYNSPELADLRRFLGEKLDVVLRVDDGDIGHIIVFSPDMTRMFRVPALNFEYANGLSAWQHRVCKSFAGRHLGRSDSSAWRKAKELITQLIKDEFQHKRSLTHKRVARYQENLTKEAAEAIRKEQSSRVPPCDLQTDTKPSAPSSPVDVALPASTTIVEPSPAAMPAAVPPIGATNESSQVESIVKQTRRHPRYEPIIMDEGAWGNAGKTNGGAS